MHVIYLDESGNSGTNLNDPQQPVFTLCAMVVAEDKWQSLEAQLKAILDATFPQWKTIPKFEIHGADLRTGAGIFSGMPVSDRIKFRDAWMDIGAAHGVRLIHRSVFKKPYAAWLTDKLGAGVLVNPHIVAFAMVSRCIDNYLKTLPGPPLAMLISDENKEIVADIEKSIHVLRGLSEGTLRLSRIVEKGFFIDSSKSLPLQLCDLFALSLRKRDERRRSLAKSKTVDDSGIERSEKLLYHDRKDDMEAIDWAIGAQKRSGQGKNPGSVDTGP